MIFSDVRKVDEFLIYVMHISYFVYLWILFAL